MLYIDTKHRMFKVHYLSNYKGQNLLHTWETLYFINVLMVINVRAKIIMHFIERIRYLIIYSPVASRHMAEKFQPIKKK